MNVLIKNNYQKATKIFYSIVMGHLQASVVMQWTILGGSIRNGSPLCACSVRFFCFLFFVFFLYMWNAIFNVKTHDMLISSAF